jgi:hypothetical protein
MSDPLSEGVLISQGYLEFSKLHFQNTCELSRQLITIQATFLELRRMERL